MNTAIWDSPSIAHAQRNLVDGQIDRSVSDWPIHFRVLADAVRATQCPGTIFEMGCASGYGREILDRAGVPYRYYTGVDISSAAIAMAKQRYPESRWFLRDAVAWRRRVADIVVDGSCLLHIDDWRDQVRALCVSSGRFVILHRIPAGAAQTETYRTTTSGYGQVFDSWSFRRQDVVDEMAKQGFEFVTERKADGDSMTMTFARPRHYVTYSNGNYLGRLKVLYRSLKRHAGPVRLHVLAWDNDVWKWCKEQADVVAEYGPDFLEQHKDLRAERLAGPPRTTVEHYWTCGPQWIADVMRQTGDPVLYTDADIMFHSSPEPVFAGLSGRRIGLVPHGFADYNQHLPGPTRQSHHQFGEFNVGLAFFGEVKAAQRWADMCRDWCYDRVEAFGPRTVPIPDRKLRYGDQKFLEDLAFEYGDEDKGHVIQHPGACPGPWSIHTRALDVRDGVVHFGNRPLVAYHYSSFRMTEGGGFVASRPEYNITPRQEQIIYAPYAKALREEM